MTDDGKFIGEGLIFHETLTFRVLPTHPLGLYSMTISLHGRRISLDCIEFSNMLLATTTAAVLQQQYYSSRGNCTPGYRGRTALIQCFA